MSSERHKLEDCLVHDTLQDLQSETEKKHFDIINERRNCTTKSNHNIQSITQNLLEKESNELTLPDNNYSGITVVTTPIPDGGNTTESLSNKPKTIDVTDSKATVVDDTVEKKSIASGLESDVEDNDSDNGTIPATINTKEYDANFDKNLPATVKLLTTPDGGKLYLVGTAHFSASSQNDVSTVIQAVQPDVVMVELCKARIHILQFDEETILQEVQNRNFQYIRETIQQKGFTNGLIYILLLNMSARLTKQLGMAPGGEFRTAFAEARKIPNCLIHMGDRPVNITFQRALSSLSWWQTIKFAWSLFTSKDTISKEEVEQYKEPDVLNKLLGEISQQFPTVADVFVRERDLYLTYSLQLACLPKRTATGYIPARVVGVVGIGHVPGIVEKWGSVLPSEIPPILRVPPPSLSSKIIRFGIKASIVGTVIYIGYKIIPIPVSGILQYISQRPKSF